MPNIVKKFRSAVTGRYVTAKEAAKNASTTVSEAVKRAIKKAK